MTQDREDKNNEQHDTGNQMSERAGYAGESKSGQNDTPVGRLNDDAAQPDAVPGSEDNLSSTGTSFGTTPGEDRGS